ncbi:hypothetical protein BDB00DRAFT_836771 [Zychaea mexicana]|uniref:uncharacterized protein n=1 Tax=Zychaea mexicana TaxID=64656 RepID=UPI0022FE0714|nr:uncharacterized protein BDB00DRAFT_836771 [Zychaea mexicana]KAI9490656.1 hypothetical protein BDB00DRAFT_836771 [Zychaea mexicana]
MDSNQRLSLSPPKTHLKAKVYYSFRGSSTTRMAVFPTTVDLASTYVPIRLRDCLWAICSSSPDMICQEHDLSIYTANFQESCRTLSDKKSSVIWEGRGLLSWIMDAPPHDESGDVTIHGKISNAKDSCEVHIELQPTLKWAKDDFYMALKAQNFECFKKAPRSPPQLSSQCCCGIDAALQPRLASVWSPSRASPPFGSSSEKGKETEFDQFMKQKRDPSSSPVRLPPTTQLFRPEPVFPNEFKRPRLTPPLDDQQDRMVRRRRVTDGSAGIGPYFLHQAAEEQRRSAFTRTTTTTSSLITKDDSNNNNNLTITAPAHHVVHPPGSIPVIYTPSNKKRKKNPSTATVLPLSNSNTPSSATNNTTDASVPKQQQHSSQPHQQQQQVSTAVRTYYDVDRDANGNYALPVEIDSWTVVDLGTIVYDRPAYHNQRYIYPANYTVRKWYRSMVDAKSDTQYTCRILDNGREPKFEVTADDCPVTYSGPTPTTVWTIIVRRAFAIRNQEYGHNPVGPDFFGLRKNTIAKMIQDLPNADKCSQYVWQTFEPARFNKPGRNRRRTDPMALLGGVNYSLTSTRSLFPHAHHAVGDYPRDPQPPPEPLPRTGVSMRLNFHDNNRTRDSSSSPSPTPMLPPPPTHTSVVTPTTTATSAALHHQPQPSHAHSAIKTA